MRLVIARFLTVYLALWVPLAASADDPGVTSAPSTPSQGLPASGATVDGMEVQAQLRSEYLVGAPVLVSVSVSNPGTSSGVFPDLAARPWLVRFEFVSPDGSSLRRSTAVPKGGSDSDRTVRIPVRAQRRILLQVPGAQATSAGSYQLGVQLVIGDTTTDIARRTVQFAPPRLVAGDLGAGTLAGTKVGLRAVWLHQAHQGFDVYLNQASSVNLMAPGTDRYLFHVDARIQPWLAASRSTEATAPVVVWQEAGHRVRVVRVDSTGVVSTDRAVDAPWPSIDIIGRPAVAGGGAVGVPIWVADPDGHGGMLRVAVLGAGAAVGFARVSRFDERPADVQTTVDASGGIQVLVRHAAGLDLYTLSGESVSAGQVLPVPGRRLLAAQAGAPVIDAQFGLMTQTPEHAGGLAVFVLTRSGAAVMGQWLDLRGTTVRTLDPQPLSESAELIAALPGSEQFGILSRHSGGMTWTQGSITQALSGPALSLQLVRGAAGQAVLRRLSTGTPIVTQVLDVPLTVPAPSVAKP